MYKCRFCGKNYCSDHRLPERHGCTGLGTFKENIYSNHKTSSDDIVKDAFKQTSAHALKSITRGIMNHLINSVKKSPSLTIIGICVLSFILSILIPGYFELFMFDPSKFILQPWTVISYMFLHGSGLHLFFNMFVLFFFGKELERRVGNQMFLVVFFLCGIVAAIGYSLATIGDLTVGMVGASGAIFGVFASVAVLAPNMRIYIYFFPMKIKYALVLLAIVDFLLLFGASTMIAHEAHLIGLFTGILMGFYLKKRNKQKSAYDYRQYI
ncbi:membrane associated rhomboid family serine protease [Methanosalsum natronophilum]|nr:membrane associated rhomboid family serine protease [Methanosalsum natronophilum]